MACYNTFVVCDCKKRKVLLVSSSARKAAKMLQKGKRIDVWNENRLIEGIYSRQSFEMQKYISLEKQYIAKKQRRAEKNGLKKVRTYGERTESC